MGRGLKLSDDPKSRVAIVQGKDIAGNLRRALFLIGGLEKIVHSHSRVLIKPNLGVALAASTGVTTDPRLICALVQLAREAGARKVLVGESAVVGFDAGTVMETLRVKERFVKAGAEVVNLDRDEVIEVPIPGGDVLKKLRVCRTAYESDVLISVPRMKTHFQTGVTLSLKNMKGTIPDASKRILHRIGIPLEKREEFGLDRAIVDLNRAISADLAVIDGLVALEGFVPGPRLVGNPVPLEMILAGYDPLAVDAVACRVMGLDPLQVRHLRLAWEGKMGRVLEEEIEVVGRSIASVLHPMRFETPRPVWEAEHITLVEGKGCSGCSVTSRLAISFMSPQEMKDLGKATLVVGETEPDSYSPQGRCFFIGNCALVAHRGKKGVFIEGCPPPGLWIRRGLADWE